MSQKSKFSISARRFHIVVNEKSLPHLSELIAYLKNERCKYILCRKGLNKKGKEHAHIYVIYDCTRRLSDKSTFGSHIAKCRGTSQQNIDYINSHHPELIVEEGDSTTKDKKERWNDFIAEIKSGKVDKYSQVYAQYEGYANRRIAELKPKRTYNGNLKAKNLWMWGPQRTGKSYWADNFLPKPKYEVYDKPPNKWWDGYTNEKIVLLEDLDPEQSKYIAHYIKKWADRKPITAAVKGGSKNICPADFHFIVTSNYPIDDCFNERDAAAIRERFEEWHIKEKMPNLPEEQ